jgi:hypothetical protein
VRRKRGIKGMITTEMETEEKGKSGGFAGEREKNEEENQLI